MAAIAQDFGVHRSSLHRWLTAPERTDQYELAKQASAEAHIEIAQRVLLDARSDPELSSAQAQVAVNLSKHHQWLAGVRDRAFGDKPVQVAVGFNFADLHMQALLAHGSVTSTRLQTRRELYPVSAELVQDAES